MGKGPESYCKILWLFRQHLLPLPQWQVEKDTDPLAVDSAHWPLPNQGRHVHSGCRWQGQVWKVLKKIKAANKQSTSRVDTCPSKIYKTREAMDRFACHVPIISKMKNFAGFLHIAQICIIKYYSIIKYNKIEFNYYYGPILGTAYFFHRRLVYFQV